MSLDRRQSVNSEEFDRDESIIGGSPLTAKDVEALLKKKEYAQLVLNENISRVGPDDTLDSATINAQIQREGRLSLHSHQLFVRYFMGPHSSRKRLLCKHDTGTGKTLTAISTAIEYIKYYRLAMKTTPNKPPPRIFVIGFSKSIFQRELLRRVEFGFVTADELQERARLHHVADTGSMADKNAAADFDSRLRSRLSKLQWDGFFKFIGYKELFNHLFIGKMVLPGQDETTAPADSEDGEGTDTSKDSDGRSRSNSAEGGIDDEEAAAANITANLASATSITLDYFYQQLANGTIKLNYDLIESFANGFIIADEIHHVYNSLNINCYGLALQFILDIYDVPDFINSVASPPKGPPLLSSVQIDQLKVSTVKLLMLTATPENNSPTEIVDLINLLVPLSELPNNKHLTKGALFTDRNLKSGALSLIGRLVAGYISFLRDVDIRYYPSRVFEGTEITIPKRYLSERVTGYTGTTLPYLRFIRCPMSPLHHATYRTVIKQQPGSVTIPSDGQALIDLVIPNPGILLKKTSSGEDVSSPALYKSREIKYSLMNATQDWRDKTGIDFIRGPSGEFIIVGEFMKLPTLTQYSTKNAAIVSATIDNLRNNGGKILIAHPFVRIFGILFIQEVLRRNGFIDEYSGATDSTLCSICGFERSRHKLKEPHHEFQAARFIVAHGEIERATLDKSLEKFNHADNVNGYNYRILIGSKVINEGYDMNSIQHIFIAHIPANISTLLQIFGRGIRKNSHIMLPPDRRIVHLHIFTSSLPRTKNSGSGADDLSYEEYRYFEKLQDYIIIQRIEKTLNENAIDSVIHRRMIAPTTNKATTVDTLGMLYFKPSSLFSKVADQNGILKVNNAHLDTSTFYPFFEDDEIATITVLIKRLFSEVSTVWKWPDLVAACRQPPASLAANIFTNPQLFLEDSIVIALDSLTNKNTSYNQLRNNPLSRLLDPSDKIIIHKGYECRIVWRKPFYMLLPIMHCQDNNEYIAAHLGNKINDTLLITEDSWYRRETVIHDIDIPIGQYLQNVGGSYDQLKYKFYQRYKDAPLMAISEIIEAYDIDFHMRFIEDAIRYVFETYTGLGPSSDLHEFYFKMLYYYDRMDMVIFADELAEISPSLATSLYSQFIVETNIDQGMHSPVDRDASAAKIPANIKDMARLNTFLFTSIYKSSVPPPEFNMKRLNEYLKGRSKAASKVPANLLPVGHFLSNTAKLYKISDSDSSTKNTQAGIWEAVNIETPLPDNVVENDIIIGYYEKTTAGLHIKFKLRQPIQKIVVYEDNRRIERGSACTTHNKAELIKLCKQLNIKMPDDTGPIKNVCNLIKLELMKRELESRRKQRHAKKDKTATSQSETSRIRWFYMHFEAQPLSDHIDTSSEHHIPTSPTSRSIDAQQTSVASD